jgi:hypothetical protein
VKREFYVEFDSVEDSIEVLNEINERIGDTWDNPKRHPFKQSSIISWNLSYLKKCEDLLNGLNRLTLQDAAKRGYAMGYHQGKFHHAAQKIEDAGFILDAMNEAMKAAGETPSLPVFRSLFYGFQAAIYSTINALCGVFQNLGGDAGKWWATKNKILKSERFIQALLVDYHTDKHGSYTGLLSARVKLFGYKGPTPDSISGEGVFVIINRGTSRERRIFHSGASCEFDPYLQIDEIRLDGNDLRGLPLTDQLEYVLWYFQDLLYESKSKFDV